MYYITIHEAIEAAEEIQRIELWPTWGNLDRRNNLELGFAAPGRID